MSATTTPNDSPVHASIQPLHNPSQAAVVAVPQAPLGNTTNGGIANQTAGMGAKALLAKKMAKSQNPKFVSPTDNVLTPCSQKIGAAKKKHFTKGAKPMGSLFTTKDTSSEDSASKDDSPAEGKTDDENPF
ncbi:hypothetical protein C8Q75DRAFT_862635 [Abortiporus biennis]|nr:hypothetical protein C8Q75DRAFT_862635 [Abortiporus biennis]